MFTRLVFFLILAVSGCSPSSGKMTYSEVEIIKAAKRFVEVFENGDVKQSFVGLLDESSDSRGGELFDYYSAVYELNQLLFEGCGADGVDFFNFYHSEEFTRVARFGFWGHPQNRDSVADFEVNAPIIAVVYFRGMDSGIAVVYEDSSYKINISIALGVAAGGFESTVDEKMVPTTSRLKDAISALRAGSIKCNAPRD